MSESASSRPAVSSGAGGRRDSAWEYEGSPMPQYLEDFTAGQRFRSATLRVEAAEIKAFAAQFDPQPFHLDEPAAQASFFGGLAARLALA